MRVRIEIKTPQGQAIATARKIKPFILGMRKVENKIWANKDDTKIIWVVDGDPRMCVGIQRNVAVFGKMAEMILSNKTVQGLAHLSQEDKDKLQDMFKNQTKVKIIKTFEQMPNTDDKLEWLPMPEK
jgi:hypothetical protein